MNRSKMSSFFKFVYKFSPAAARHKDTSKQAKTLMVNCMNGHLAGHQNSVPLTVRRKQAGLARRTPELRSGNVSLQKNHPLLPKYTQPVNSVKAV